MCSLCQNDALTHYWFDIGTLFATMGPTLEKNGQVIGLDLSCLRCGIDNGGLMYVNCLRRWPNMKSTLTIDVSSDLYNTTILG